MGNYARFGWMVLCSTLVMFGLMYLNTYEAAHVHFSQTRAWMALVMGAAMAIVMLTFMLGMYKSRRHNDPRVRKLADGIAATQRREIAEMEALIANIERNGPRRTADVRGQ
jgi:signal transduction histidine kinase